MGALITYSIITTDEDGDLMEAKDIVYELRTKKGLCAYEENGENPELVIYKIKIKIIVHT